MATVTETELAATLAELQGQVAEILRRMEALEKRKSGFNGPAAAASSPPAVVPQVAAAPPKPAPAAIVESITEDELLAISAALGAYLGVRPHIRHIRLVSTTAWAQQGRVSIQASHTLQG